MTEKHQKVVPYIRYPHNIELLNLSLICMP